MRKTHWVAITMLVLAAGTATAAEPSYTYLEGGYVDVGADLDLDLDLDILGLVETDGWFAGFSFRLANFHFIGNYEKISGVLDFSDTTTWNAGAGWHGLLGRRADLVIEASYIDFTMDTPDGKISENGYLGTGGIRWRLVKWFEINGFVNYTDLDVATGGTSYEINAVFYLGPINLGLGYKTNDVEIAAAYLRWNFGG